MKQCEKIESPFKKRDAKQSLADKIHDLIEFSQSLSLSEHQQIDMNLRIHMLVEAIYRALESSRSNSPEWTPVKTLMNKLIKVQEEVGLDLLTHLFTQEAFWEKLRSFLVVEQRQVHVTLIVADLRDLKQCNDRFGHDAGTEAIRLTGATLKEYIRYSEEALGCRYGGDEFVVFLTNCNDTAAMKIAERLVASLDAAFEERNLPTRLDMGFASILLPPHPQRAGKEKEFADALFRAADRLMYRAKKYAKKNGGHASSFRVQQFIFQDERLCRI